MKDKDLSYKINANLMQKDLSYALEMSLKKASLHIVDVCI